MFGFLNSTLNKVLAGVVVGLLVIAGVLYWQYGRSQDKLVEARVDAGQAQATVKDQQKTLDQNNKSADVTDKTQVQVVTETKVIRETADQIEARVQKRIQQIRDQAASAPKTPEGEKKTKDAVSKARLDGLWELFCTQAASKPECAAYVPKPSASGASQ